MRTNIKSSKNLIKISVFVCTLLFCVLLTGCGEKESTETAVLDENLFGTWNQITEDESPSLEDLGIPSGYVFGEDGKGTDLFWDVTFKYATEDGVLYIDYDDVTCDDTSYNYYIEGDIIQMTRTAEDALTMFYQKEAQEVPEETESK